MRPTYPRPFPLFSLFILAMLLWLEAAPLAAFGKNKVITHTYRWKVRTTAHFDIHYTAESEPILSRVAYYLERAHGIVSQDLDIPIDHRTPFFILPNHNQFEENNIVEVGEGTGGVTEAFKNRFIIFNDGTEFWLRHVVTHEFAHVGEFEVLYGGFWKSARLLKSPLYPLWAMEGYAEYVTGSLDQVEEDLYLRDAATSGRLYSLGQLHGFSHLKPFEVTLGYKQGGAAVRFLAEEYGRENTAALMAGLRERFEPGSVIQDLTGQDFRAFDRRYLEYLQDYYAIQSEGLKEPETYGERLTPGYLLPVWYAQPAISPDGRWLAFLKDFDVEMADSGVMLYDFNTKEIQKIKGTRASRVENVHGLLPREGRALSFSPDSRWLAFAGEKEQRDYVYLYDVKRRRLRRLKTPFEQVRSPTFNPAGDRLAVVGMKNGTNDIYEISTRGALLRRLTESMADESDPAYAPDGASLVYSQEVLVRKPGADTEEATPERDLIMLNLATLSSMSLTNLPGDERSPAFLPDGRSIVFTAAADGVTNLYTLDLAAGRAKQITHVVGGNFEPAVARDGSFMVFTSFRRGYKHLYRADPSLWTAPSSSATVVYDNLPSKGAWASLTAAAPAAAKPQASLKSRGAPPAVRAGALPPADEEAMSPPKAPEEMVAISDRRPYKLRASTDLFFPVFYYSSADGLYVATLWQYSEYLGNHQLQTNFQYSSGDRFLDYDVTYTYKRFRPQFVIGGGGKSYYKNYSRTEVRKESNFLTGIVYPLDRVARLEVLAASIFREDSFPNSPQLNNGERENVLSGSYVRDTTAGRYLSVLSGDRFRFSYDVSRPAFGGDRNYDAHTLEYHHFEPTGRESALAFRGMSSVSTGKSPVIYRLGGDDRLRGYARNEEVNKSSRYVIGNLEWRVPLKYLNYYTWFFFPDFYFRAVYGTLFTDVGYDWDRSSDLRNLQATHIRNSVGGGLRIPTFILQTYLITLSLDVAKRTDLDDWVYYLGIGPAF